MRLILPVAVFLVTAHAAVAQPQQAQGTTPFVAVGCVAHAVHDGSLTGSPGVPPATPNTAPVLANSSEPTGAYVLNGATPPAAAATGTAAAKPFAYALDGSAQQLQPHVGHRVEVTGRLVRGRTGTAASEKTPVDRIQVASVKMLEASCPQPSTPK